MTSKTCCCIFEIFNCFPTNFGKLSSLSCQLSVRQFLFQLLFTIYDLPIFLRTGGLHMNTHCHHMRNGQLIIHSISGRACSVLLNSKPLSLSDLSPDQKSIHDRPRSSQSFATSESRTFSYSCINCIIRYVLCVTRKKLKKRFKLNTIYRVTI